MECGAVFPLYILGLAPGGKALLFVPMPGADNNYLYRRSTQDEEGVEPSAHHKPAP